ncbi:Ubiquinone/menaquinone biosynthesis C-methyltransferase UbiE [invertebrate metagenome]|uniref:Ubiquinone/menaquinone biosynthesis C-methyltransferase UbiE n=1 Tax=invertebrate metagenome TaxID=1711999 RepID=A0A2H9T4G6_9ZZZZ
MTGKGGKNDTTHFGYKTVSRDAKQDMVGGVFTSVAHRYDIMNDLMSMGIHRIWKRFAIELAGVRPGHQVLDVAGGTGDLSRRFSALVGDTGRVLLTDINEAMLHEGRNRLLDTGKAGNIEFVQANAECLPFEDNTFDCVTISFGLRNVTNKDQALESMCRILKPGGVLLILEFSKVSNPLLAKMYDAYSFTLLPLMGRLVAHDSDSYKYLAESIRMHPDQETLKEMMEDAGFVNTSYHNMTGGVVAVHKGVKP